MKQNIRFRGLSFNRDEQSAEHGELSLCAGAELHDGALRPSVLEGSKVQHKETVDDQQVDVDSVLQVKVSGNDVVATLVYVHETPSYRHYICEYDKKLYWFKEDGTVGSSLVSTSHVPIHTFTNNDGDIISVNSVGNTLLVMTENTGIHYILWKDTYYKYLGTQIPFLPISFRPSEQYTARYDRSTIDTNAGAESQTAWRQFYPGEGNEPHNSLGVDQGSKIVTLKKEIRSVMTEAVQAIVNQANNTVAKDGHFYAPFLLRYCYRLYDGSMIMHSAPVFMDVSLPQSIRVYCMNVGVMKYKRWHYPNQDPTPWLPCDESEEYINTWSTRFVINDGDNTYETAKDNFVLKYSPSNVGIEYLINYGDDNPNTNPILTALKEDWGDIVSSVDIFVTAPIIREKLGELLEQVVLENGYMYGVRKTRLVRLLHEMMVEAPYEPIDFLEGRFYNDFIFDIPQLSDDEYLQKILNTSNFFKIASYKLDDLIVGYSDGLNGYRTLKYDKSIIPNITVQEEMKDDYHTHNQLLPISNESGMYVYNHRLNVYGMKEKLFEGFQMSSMTNWCYDSYHDHLVDFITDITVELNTEDGKKYVKVPCYSDAHREYEIDPYNMTKALLFYPDSRATRMFITVNYTDRGKIVLKMEPLSFLNGAVASEAFWKDDLDEFYQQVDIPEVNNIVPLPNRIITSEVDNPYYFPLEGRNAVGIGSVKGIAAVTRALSQGQVGDHDLVIFSTDGIWVLKVSSTGTYMSSHNISREVCSNVRSICQLDQSIVFATQRNLSKFVESDVVSISEVLDGPIPNLVTMLPGLAAWFTPTTPPAEENPNADTNIVQMLNWGTPAVDMFNQGRVFYDYAGLRVIVLPADTSNASVALVFSIRDLTWSTMCVPAIKAVIPGYPSPFVQLGGGNDTNGKVMILNKQYDYTVPQNPVAKTGLIVTRTLTFSDTMDVLRGFRQLTDCEEMPMLFFYGSNNQRTWKLIGHTAREFYEYMPGHPYRFFRIAINTSMLPNEEYQQLELEVINKYAKL